MGDIIVKSVVPVAPVLLGTRIVLAGIDIVVEEFGLNDSAELPKLIMTKPKLVLTPPTSYVTYFPDLA